ncbi:MAG: hypothetical protein U0Q12_06780 [Vicinamibacterales bacterium]
MRVVCYLQGVILTVSLVALTAGRVEAATDCVFNVAGTKMVLAGDCTTDATIYVPAGFTLDGAGHTITAVDPAGDHWRGAVVRNAGPTANVKRLTVTAFNLMDVCDTGAGVFGEDRLRGIAFYGASGSITGNRIIGLRQGSASSCTEGTGILAESAPFDGTHPHTQHVDIEDNVIVDVQRVGIAVQGDIQADVAGNRVDLSSQVGAVEQFAIGMAYGAAGDVENNRIRSGFADGAGFTASGVFLFEASRTRVTRNLITRVHEGVLVQSWCIQGAQHASRNVIATNAISAVHEGIVLVARSYPSSTCDPHVDQNQVAFNSIASGPGITAQTGVFYGVQSLGGTFTPVADTNTVAANLITGFAFPLFDSSSTNTRVVGNVIR